MQCFTACLFTDGADLHVESLDSGCTSTMPSEEVAEPSSSDAEIEPENEQGQQFTVTCSHPNIHQYSCALGVHFTLPSLYTSYEPG